MILYPAIDLKDGRCVRLRQGDMARATVFNDDPAAQAAAFAAAGCAWLHVVDLNGAIDGRPVNEGPVRAILQAVSVPVQLGGGIRDEATAEAWLEAGIARIVLGTLALEEPERVRRLARRFPDRIAVGIDARDGRVAARGWVETSEIETEALAARFADAGIAAIVHTDIARDGAMAGPNLAASAALAAVVPVPVIVSGGVRDTADLREVRRHHGIAGVIIGRALYDGGLDLSAALAALAAPAASAASGPC